MNPLTFNGIRVIISKPVKYEFTTNRSWKERLFSLPFNPFKAIKTEVVWSSPIKDGEVIRIDRSLHMTQKTWLELQEKQNKPPPCSDEVRRSVFRHNAI